MKIFPQTQSRPITSKGHKKAGKLKEANTSKMERVAPEKSRLSESEVREKLAAHVQTSKSAKSQSAKKMAVGPGESFMNPEVLVPKTKAETKVEEGQGTSLKDSHLLLSDVNLNDPKDTNTQEKLKSILASGAFNFNPKERENLERILNSN